MTTTHPPRRANDAQAEAAAPQNVRAEQALAVLRIGFGLTFLWAFLDKLLALGFHTGAITDQNGNRTEIDVLARGEAWVNGGSPTAGFLSGVSEQNPLHGVFTAMAGAVWADWLFMIGLLGIGVALSLGIGLRIAAGAGAVLYLLMWLASLPLDNNPVIDDHLLGAISVVVLALTLAGGRWGLGNRWARTAWVQKYGVLR